MKAWMSMNAGDGAVTAAAADGRESVHPRMLQGSRHGSSAQRKAGRRAGAGGGRPAAPAHLPPAGQARLDWMMSAALL